MEKTPYTNATDETHTSLGFLVLMILNRLRTQLELSELAEQHQEESERNAARGGAYKERAEDDRADIDQRLKKRTGTASQVWGDPEWSRARTK